MRSLKYYIVIIPYRSDSLFHGLYHITDRKMFKTLQSNHSTETRCNLVPRVLSAWIGTAVIPRRNENQRLCKIWGGRGQIRCIIGDVQVAICCLSSAISTVDNGTLIRESDSKAIWRALEILRKCILVRTVYMTHSSLVKLSFYFEMYRFRCFLGKKISVFG